MLQIDPFGTRFLKAVADDSYFTCWQVARWGSIVGNLLTSLVVLGNALYKHLFSKRIESGQSNRVAICVIIYDIFQLRQLLHTNHVIVSTIIALKYRQHTKNVCCIFPLVAAKKNSSKSLHKRTDSLGVEVLWLHLIYIFFIWNIICHQSCQLWACKNYKWIQDTHTTLLTGDRGIETEKRS